MATTLSMGDGDDELLEDVSESTTGQLRVPNQEVFAAEMDERYRRMKSGEAIERDLVEA